jgi:hypothetical protein
MQKRIAALLLAGAMGLALGGAALAQADPTVHQIYEAAAGGRLDQAQQMIEQVLRDHPDSAKAHYVQSELFAREGKLGAARQELERAEQIEPGLPKENPRSVAELKEQIDRSSAGVAAGLSAGGYRPAVASTASVTHFPWGMLLILALSVGVLWMLFRRRTAAAGYPLGAATASPGGYGAYPAAGGFGPGVGAGGLGSTIAGGLAGGLAAGAGIVAGEELAHHFLDGEHPSASAASLAPASLTDDNESIGANSDMGGTDFGVQDAGSWDDNSGGDAGGGGGDDWT